MIDKHMKFVLKTIVSLIITGTILVACKTETKTKTQQKEAPDIALNMADRWQFIGEAINEPGYDIWGSSPIRDDEGKVHLFCARWKSDITFTTAWRYNSEIAHYVSDSPEGPFEFVEVVKGTDKNTGWKKVGFHNPNIRKVGDTYVLVFIANDGSPKHGPNQRIGMMVAKDLNGPWRFVPNEDTPLLSPPEDANMWCHNSGCGVNNPSLLAHPNGKFYLYFKAMTGPRPEGKIKMGVAIADNLEGPYVIQKDPITKNKKGIEDGYAFIWNDKICFVTTDNHGILEKGGGLLWTSDNGIDFDPRPQLAFHNFGKYYLKGKIPDTAKHHYSDWVKLERPQVLLGNDGNPAYLYCPSGTALDGSDGTNSYVFRLKNK